VIFVRGGEPAADVNGPSESEDTPDRFKAATGEVGVTGTPGCEGIVLSYFVVVIEGGAPGRLVGGAELPM